MARRSRWVFGALLTLIMLGTAIRTEAATYDATAKTAAATRLNLLNLVKGRGTNLDGTPDLALNANITRAELMVLMVRALGGEATAKAVAEGAGPTPDTESHWARGYVRVGTDWAAKNGTSLGLPGGSFDPNGSVTATQTIAFVMKFLGVKPAAGIGWPNDYLQGAVDAGLLTAEDRVLLQPLGEAPADRGTVFYLLDYAFSHYQLPGGGTVYTTYVDTEVPDLTLDAYDAVTEAEQITLSGSVSADAATVWVGEGASPATVEKGHWSIPITLMPGENSLAITAVDHAGNHSTKTISITRTGVKAKVLHVEMPSEVEVGSSTAVSLTFEDGSAATDYAVTITGDIGTFDKATSTFTASTLHGEGTIAFHAAGSEPVIQMVKVVPGPISVLVLSPQGIVRTGETVPFTVYAYDEHNNKIHLTGQIEWSASAGTITSDGIWTAPSTPGPVVITVTVDGHTGEAQMEVLPQ